MRWLPTLSDFAYAEGLEHGKNAGTWVIDGNTTDETKEAFLKGFEDGDPAVYDALPSSPLSGEYADGLLPRDVLGWYSIDEGDDRADDILSAYEDGYSQGIVGEVERACLATLERTS
jgi:hypothetical protein